MTKSEEWNQRLLKVMPKGSSTNSKAPHYVPDEPGVIVRGKGCRVWDADGREYIDFRNSLGPVTLGYQFPAVDNAIREQLENGIIFGHPHPLECEVAEMICEVIPCAEQARFLKTGGEAIAACIKLARHYTGRDHIIQIGYNGWLNSLAAKGKLSPRLTSEGVPAGVPAALSALHHSCSWNDIAGVEEAFGALDDQVAAVVVAADYVRMAEGGEFYPALRKFTEGKGALLIFDEIVTGFRVAIAGVQEYFGVTPDLAVFAKGVANGMPLAVYAGKREVMSGAEKAVISSTYGGETLSLAAAKAAITTYRTEDVIGHLWRMAEKMGGGCNDLFVKYGFPIEVRGLWPAATFAPGPDLRPDFQEKFFRAAYRNGVSLYGLPYVNYSHTEADIGQALDRLDNALSEIN